MPAVRDVVQRVRFRAHLSTHADRWAQVQKKKEDSAFVPIYLHEIYRLY